jgi:hypothetical protein
LRIVAALLALMLMAPTATHGQQVADRSYKPSVEQPSYPGTGPAVGIDQGHNNYHTLSGRYAPFGKLLSLDGYSVRASTGPITTEALRGLDVLVIANARADTGSAFSDQEIATLRDWVAGGGGLLLIADHAPFGSAARNLARAFGVDMGGGYVATQAQDGVTSRIRFSGSQLGEHPILKGREGAEQVRRATSFTGQSLFARPPASPLLILPADALEVTEAEHLVALQEGRTAPGARVGGRAQAIALELGRGRVVVAGEAAMFTAQVTVQGRKIGLAVDSNERFALNVMHWLSALIR